MRTQDPMTLLWIVRRVEVIEEPANVRHVPSMPVVPCELPIAAHVHA